MKKIIALFLVLVSAITIFAGCALFEETSTSHAPILILEKINPTKNQPDRDILKNAKMPEDMSKIRSALSSLTNKDIDRVTEILKGEKYNGR